MERKNLELKENMRDYASLEELLVLANIESIESKLNVVVVALHKFPSFDKLYKSLPLLRCGYTKINISQAFPTDMNFYYTK